MATRSRTVLFMQYRNSLTRPSNRIKSSVLMADGSEMASLMANADTTVIEMETLPPKWIDVVDEINQIIETIKSEIKDLDAMHKNHLLPTFADKTKEEAAIENLTEAITKKFHGCQHHLKKIENETLQAQSNQGIKFSKNIQISLATKLQDLSKEFRRMQTNYLQRIRGRESKTKDYVVEDMENVDLLGEGNRHGFTQQQFQLLEENEQAIEGRSKEINEIAKSIFQLADIFKELQALVIDQGTLLDRIDYNIEQVHENMQCAVQELTKAEEHQKSSQKICIIVLVVLVLVFMVLLIFKLSSRH